MPDYKVSIILRDAAPSEVILFVDALGLIVEDDALDEIKVVQKGDHNVWFPADLKEEA